MYSIFENPRQDTIDQHRRNIVECIYPDDVAGQHFEQIAFIFVHHGGNMWSTLLIHNNLLRLLLVPDLLCFRKRNQSTVHKHLSILGCSEEGLALLG